MEYASAADLEGRLRRIFDGRYRIDEELLGGGMSRVFLAEEIALQRRIVIKILPPDIAADVNRDRFRREIGFAARLQHPHIVPLLAAGEEDGLLYYTMPFIDGSSLKAITSAGRKLRPSEVVEILIDVTDALAYAHREGVIHRDIKPANLLMKDRHAVITDFGVAKALTSARSDLTFAPDNTSGGMTTAGHIIGTPAYMAPEQIAGDGAADHRVDIYALGLLGYELLCGRAPFRGPSPQATIAAQLTQDPEPISVVRSDVPPMLAALISRCLEKDPNRRPPSADAVLEVLRTMDLASGTHLRDAVVITQGRARRNAMLAVGALAVVSTVAWWQLKGGSSDNSTLIANAAAADSAAKQTVMLESKAQAQAVADSAAVSRALRDSAQALRKRLTYDSTRSAAMLAQMEQRLFARLRDSVTNAVRQATLDSIAKRQVGVAAEIRMAESISRAVRVNIGNMAGMGANIATSVPPRATVPPLTAEAFVARRSNMGGPRRIAVGLYSALPKTPDLVLAAAALRDSVIAALRAQPRYIVVPADSFTIAQQKSRTYDTLSVLLHTEMFVVINASTSGALSDSVRWTLQLRDMGAHSTYQTRSVNSSRLALADGFNKELPKLFSLMAAELRNMDMAPRAPGK